MKQGDVTNLIGAWNTFFNKNNWTDLTAGLSPINGGCGLVYELPNFLNRPNESIAIVDMRQVVVAEPHYHPHTEVYFVLHGEALVVIGKEKRSVKAGDVVVIPPYQAHYTLPNDEFIIACVNTPPFRLEHYIPLTSSNDAVDFDYAEFKTCSGIEVREIVDVDAERLAMEQARLISTAHYAEYYRDNPSAAVGIGDIEQHLDQLFQKTISEIRDKKRLALLAYSAGNPIGFMTFNILEHATILFLHTLPVDPSYKKREPEIRLAFLAHIHQLYPEARRLAFAVQV
jgi:mannose-6-phosphate isomerase-like protein (cupin superfamily)